MGIAVSQQELFTEVFPVKTGSIPTLSSWQIRVGNQETVSLGWKLAYRLGRLVGGHWIWAEGKLVSDTTVSQDEMNRTLQQIWNDPSVDFGNVRGITLLSDWNPHTLTIADFVAFGLAGDLQRTIEARLGQHRRNLNNAYVERDYSVRGWEVDGHPAVSISVFSQVVYTTPFQVFVNARHDLDELLGLLVKDKTSTLKGEIVEIVGPLSDHRTRLLSYTKRDPMIAILQNAPDDELVVKVKPVSNDGYDYPVSALQLVIRTKDYERLAIDGQAVLSELQIKPDQRSRLVGEVAQILRTRDLLEDTPYRASQFPECFLTSEDIGFEPAARLGDGYITSCDSRAVLRALVDHPPYRRESSLSNGKPIRISVLNLIGGMQDIPNYMRDIRHRLRTIHFDVDFVGAERVATPSAAALENAIDRLAEAQPHILLVFLPGSPVDEENESNLYNRVKGIAIRKGVQSQVIYERTVGNRYALDNIALGILGKTGNVPFVLAAPLPYADVIAGVDIARERTQRRSGSINMAAVTRIYQADGDFLRYFLNDAPIEGETLPGHVLRSLFPAEHFAGKRAVVHRDGPFRGDEIDQLMELAADLGSEFHPIEVIKSGVPRLYLRGQTIERPDKGSIFRLSDNEAFLVSSLPIHRNSTPRPLLIRTYGTLPIEKAVHSVLSMTVLHHGSLLPPRLPVTIHYSDRIGYLALHGVKPRNLEGSIPFWM